MWNVEVCEVIFLNGWHLNQNENHKLTLHLCLYKEKKKTYILGDHFIYLFYDSPFYIMFYLRFFNTGIVKLKKKNIGGSLSRFQNHLELFFCTLT